MGIIGHGRFGALLRQMLERHAAVACYDPAIPELAAPEQLARACAAHMLFLCVPILEFEACLKQVAPLLEDEAVVIDVLSVKEFALDAMKRLLPASVGILPAHPMFGPDAAKAGWEGLPFVLCPCDRTPASVLEVLRQYLTSIGLRVTEMSCEEHDRITARSLCLTQLLGRAMDGLGIVSSPIDTAMFGNMLKMRQMAVNDSWQLFEGLQTHNRFAANMRGELITELIALDELLTDA
jgi:prephenate dehydrogenase